MFKVMVGGTVVGSYENREDAQERLYQVRNSFLAMVHPWDTMFVRNAETGETIY